jgi:hypothetical protein
VAGSGVAVWRRTARNCLDRQHKLQSHVPALTIVGLNSKDNAFVRSEIFTAVTMKNAVFWMWRRLALERTDVSEELIASIMTLTRIMAVGTTLTVTLRVSVASHWHRS